MRDICIFAHYDRDDLVDPYVLHYLAALKDCGFETVFVTSSAIAASEIARVREHCVDCIVRDNVGHDFGSWSAGLARYRHKVTGRLLLANDSVYGPLFPLQPQLDRLTSVGADFYGMVCSNEHIPHLQSWFMLFEPHVVLSQAFADVFCQSPRPLPRETVIAEQELTATQRLAQAGFTYHALHMPGPRALLGNPMVFLWREVVEHDGIPFLKAGVLRDDRVGDLKDNRWRALIAKHDADLRAAIDAHMSRAQSHAAPEPPFWIKWRRRLYQKFLQIDDLGARRDWPGVIRLNSFVFRVIYLMGDWRRRIAPPQGRGGDNAG